MKPLNEFLDQIEKVSQEYEIYYNKETEEFEDNFLFDPSMNNPEIDFEDDGWIRLPTSFEIHEYRIMESFIGTVTQEKIRRKLENSIRGKGAFRRFKDTCFDYDILTEYYTYLRNQQQEIIIVWCERNGIEYEENKS
ncbi:UPF0158 family protein [Anaerorhabdus furcosa]|uniref:Uncharacterized protein family (UPF0158) n=1 Tax=Anaerorhabdus furcosa TaxID=118967 RepID=A0A1T4NP27_9FIRM|nr:UPF0158 family protein [Anaerorhabdus furcosa]SJZ81061.1 Uncharacterised protein family (UPF0158) [Anaerorhabdus furcosa]